MNNVYSVSEINRYLRGLLENDVLLSSIFVRGEVSNLKYHTSGHIYFSLKDEGGTLPCVMFAAARRGLTFPMQNGDKIVVSGSISVYERDGRVQLYARAIRREGAGELYERFLLLKKELEESGMFDARYKRPIPLYATKIGVVTAKTGAAIRDIESIVHRRNPYVEIYLYPAQVQGKGAKESIVRGIEVLDAMGLDVLIVGRGGGSIEDLWAFNEECVARAIFACRTPVISAVGHETDTTIADFVADRRAPTPSAAAELAVFDYASFVEKWNQHANSLQRAMQRTCFLARTRLRTTRSGLERLRPDLRWANLWIRYDALHNRLDAAMEERLLAAYRTLSEERDAIEAAVRKQTEECTDIQEQLRTQLDRAMKNLLAERKQTLDLQITRMMGLSPLSRLSQGFSFVETKEGRMVRSVHDTVAGEDLKIRVKDGLIFAKTVEIKALETSFR